MLRVDTAPFICGPRGIAPVGAAPHFISRLMSEDHARSFRRIGDGSEVIVDTNRYYVGPKLTSLRGVKRFESGALAVSLKTNFNAR